MAACPRPRARHTRRLTRSAAKHVGACMGLRAAPPAPHGRPVTRHEVLRREHLLSRSTRACLFRAPAAAGDPDLSCLRDQPESDSLLQPSVSLDVRDLGTGDVPAGPRTDAEFNSGLCRRPDLRVRALSGFAGVAPGGTVGAVDALRVLRA